MNEFENKLEQELVEQGASGEELRDLIGLKNKITKLSDVRRSDAFKRSFLRRLEERKIYKQFYSQRRFITPVFFLVLLMFISIAGVVNAQNSLPGQPLYPVKILSENVIKTVNPAFKGEILKRRSEEIRTLTEEKKNSGQIKKTIEKYENDLKESGALDKDKIEEFKKNLEDAKDNSEGEDKKEIEDVIKQTEDKIKESHKDEDEKKDENVKGVKSSKESDHDEKDEDEDRSHEAEDVDD